ncbi:MAG: type 1 pili tip component [Pseudomonadota bacterium]
MKIEQLISCWKMQPREEPGGKKYSINISPSEAAKIAAIQELYSGLSSQMVIHQLLVTALSSFEEALPYIQGSKVISEDEFGDPIFEDIGDTPKYIKLIEKYDQQLAKNHQR